MREGETQTRSAGAGPHQQILGKQRKEPPGQNRAKSREKAQLIHSSAAECCQPESTELQHEEHVGGACPWGGQGTDTKRHTPADTAGREPWFCNS